MKTVLSVLCIIIVTSARAQTSKDLPAPTANLVTLTSGSYVIPMDNSLQANASGYFNLKSYGLIIHLLNNNVKLKWVIKAGKAKDGTDFTGTAIRILPTASALPGVYNFLAGPFVIQAADTTGVAALVETFYTIHSLSGNNRPAIYKITVPVTVDIRHDLSGFKPKAAILNDGGNAAIHIGYMQAAGITTANYSQAIGIDLFTKCYTFASEPHSNEESISIETARAVRTFVTYGGNFLAQCEAVLAYENNTNYGHFHSTNGLTKVNTLIAHTSTIYPNPDLPYTQIHGTSDIAAGGSVRNWVLSSFSSFTNNAHNHATGGSLASQTPIGSSVSKINASDKAGGLVFYLGNHEFSSYTNEQSINGIRMYMNAFLTPVSLNLNCNLGQVLDHVLSANTESFTVVSENNHSVLEWTVHETTTSDSFVIEKSFDGQKFISIAKVNAINGRKSYRYNDPHFVGNAVLYYRIKATDVAGHSAYSAIRAIRVSNNERPIQMFPNPAGINIMIQLPATWLSKNIVYEIMDQGGKLIKKEAGKVNSNLYSINLSGFTPGSYFIRTVCDGQTEMQKFLKQ